MSDYRKEEVPPRGRMLVALAVATAIGSAGLAAGGTAGALLGVEITGTEAAAGLPLGLLVVGQAVAALLVSGTTGRVGRGLGLALGYVLGVIGAVLVIVAAAASSFAALLAGSAVLGGGNAAVFLTRYAAAEVGGQAMRGRAVGAGFFATALGAVASPNLLGPGGDLARLIGLPPLAGLYLVAILCFAIAALLLAAVSNPGAPFFGRGSGLLGAYEGSRVSREDLLGGLCTSPARSALLILAAVNLVMVAVMAIAPVHLSAHGHGLGLVGFIVAVHVAGMFVPSPVSGWMADRVGPTPVAGGGFLLLVAAGITGAVLDIGSAPPMTAMLLLLGVGWNFGVVGGSTLLAASVPASLRPYAEGLGEVSMGLAAGASAPVAGMIVAFGGFAALSVTGATIATTVVLALAFARWRA